MPDECAPAPMLPRIEVKRGGFYLVVRGTHEPEDWYRVYACVWDQVRRRYVPARRKLPTNVVFVSKHGWTHSAMLEWQHVLGREYRFLEDPEELAGLLRRARALLGDASGRGRRRPR